MWAPVQSINLGVMVPAMQPAVVAGVNVGWQTTLSILNHYHDHGSPRRPAGTTRTLTWRMPHTMHVSNPTSGPNRQASRGGGGG